MLSVHFVVSEKVYRPMLQKRNYGLMNESLCMGIISVLQQPIGRTKEMSLYSLHVKEKEKQL